jgi:hypothetical protein
MEIFSECAMLFFGFSSLWLMTYPPSEKWKRRLGLVFLCLAITSPILCYYLGFYIFNKSKVFKQQLSGEIAMIAQIGGTYSNLDQDPVAQKKFLELKEDWKQRVKTTLGSYNRALAGRFGGKERELESPMKYMDLTSRYDQELTNIPSEEELLEEFIKEPE